MIPSNYPWMNVLVGLALGLVGVPAARADDARAAPDDNVTSYQFEAESVHGDLRTPYGEILQVRVRGERSSLIRVRENFIAELLKSAERL